MPDWDSKIDADLLTEFSKSGSHPAFAALVERHGAMVHAISMRVLSNHHDAQDVTQAVFLALARETPKLAGKPSVAGWLHTVSHRLSLNAVGSRKSRQRREQEAAMNPSTDATPPAALGTGFRRQLDAALARLPDRYRQPLVLFHLEGATLDETARRLGLHPGTLRTRLSRARNLLQQDFLRRGVGVSSVAILTTLFAAEAKAATLPAALLDKLLDATGGSAIPPNVLELAGKAATTSPVSLSTIAMLMKTKTALASAALLLAAIGTGTHIVIQEKQNDAPTSQANASSPSPNQTRSTTRTNIDPLSKISTQDELNALIESVFLIENEAGRLLAIRRKLGLDISAEQYHEAITTYHFLIDPITIFGELLRIWATHDPSAMARWTRRFPPGLGDKFLPAALASWLAQDETAARTWATKENIDPQTLAAAEKTQHDIMSKATAAIPLPGAALTHAQTTAWAKADPDAALQWAREIESAERRVEALLTVLPEWQRQHPEHSIEEIADLGEFPDHKLQILITKLVRDRSARDPHAAIDYVTSLDPTKMQQTLMADVMEFWIRKSPEEAKQWLTTQEPGVLRDIALKEACEHISRNDFPTAANMVREIGDPEVKAHAMYGLMTTGKAIKNHFEESLRLADQQLADFKFGDLRLWGENVAPADVPAFKTWLEKNRNAGRIRFSPHLEPEIAEEEGYRFILEGLK